jgi:hypothetical protein
LKSALAPFLLFLSVIVSSLAARGGEGLLPAPAAALLLAPLLYQAGARLRTLERGLLRSAIWPAAAQVAAATFLLGGAAYALLPGWASGPWRGGGLGAALLWGLVLSVGEILTPGERSEGRGGGERERFSLLARTGETLTLSIAALLFPVLCHWAARGEIRVEPLALARELGTALGLGACAGLAGGLLLRVTRRALPREFIHLLSAEAATLAAASAGGSLPLAMVSSGAAAAFVSRSAGEAEESSRAGEEGGEGLEPVLPGSVWLLAGAGLLALAASNLFPSQVLTSLWLGAGLWGGSVLVRLLVQLGAGGARRWFRPREVPARWLPALAWASSPGPAAAGLLLLGAEAVGPDPLGVGLGWAAPAFIAPPLLALTLAILLQGSTWGTVAARWAAGSVKPRSRARWELLLARSVALLAERREVAELRKSGRLDEEAAASMEAMITAAERRTDQALAELAESEPSLRRADLGSAVRAVLAAGREAVARARRRGWLAAGEAAEVERELALRWARSPEGSLHELLGPAAEPPALHPRAPDPTLTRPPSSG